LSATSVPERSPPMPFRFLRRAFPVVLLCGVTAAPALAMEEFDLGDTSLSGSYLAGRFAGQLHDMDIAAKYFQNALDSDPNNPVLIERVFIFQLSEGNITDAEDYATRVLSFNSQHRMARIVLGLRDFRLKRYRDAREHFRRSAYTPVGELTAALLTGWSEVAEGNLAEALKSLDKLDSNDAFENFKSFHSALIADFAGMPLRAETYYKKAYEQAGTSLRVVQAYGNFLERTGRRAEARQIYDLFLTSSDDNPLILAARARLDRNETPKPFVSTALEGAGEALFSLASALSDDQSSDVALVYAQLALSLQHSSPITQTLIGDIYENMDRYDKAILSYQNIPATSELRENADIETSINLQRLERSPEAEQLLAKLIVKDPKNYDAFMTLGNIHRANEDFAKAADDYTHALALVAMPTRANWTAFYYRGIAFERTKQWEKAEADFRQALKLEPNQPLVLNYLGYSMIEKKLNLSEALEMVRKAVELKPNDGYVVDSLGWAHYQLGEYDEAVRQLERAVELKPADPTIADHLGDAYWRVGRQLEARFQWQHAKDNKPTPEDLPAIEAKLKSGLVDQPPVTPAENKVDQGNNG
jgi:tetratricopeptide (TPR) repeat protein